jgi:CRISPR-associated protein Cmr5
MSTTKAQQRSAFALEELQSLSCSRENFDREKFAKFSAGLPSMILQNGLGQTLAFLLGKGKIEHLDGFSIIKNWLYSEKILSTNADRPAVYEISQLNQQDYLKAQSEALKMLEWLKRYANSNLF